MKWNLKCCLSRDNDFSSYLTVGGFNIFRIFEKGKESQLQSSKKASEEKVDSTSSVKVDESKRKGTESGKQGVWTASFYDLDHMGIFFV